MSAKLPVMDLSDCPTGCCPRFDPAPWDGKELDFEGLRFVAVRSRSLFHIPLDMGKVMARTQKAIGEAGAAPGDRFLMFSRELSPWRAEHRLLVEGDVPGMVAEGIPGRYLAKVFEGPYRKAGEWCRAMAALVKEWGAAPGEILAFYTTCPKCAKAYGKNYVVLFGRVA